jgi:quercetin dioxygenase-like cupin family protein
MSLATPAAERKPPAAGSIAMPPRWMVEECSREFGQIAGTSLPFADPPTEENMITRPSTVNPIKPYGIHAKDAPAYWSQGILWTILASAQQTGGSYSLMEELCPKDSGPPPHTHEQDEVIYVIEGELTMIIGAQKRRATAGALAYIPARCVHSFRVDSREARLLNFYLPGGFERVITGYGVPATSQVIPPPDLKYPGTPEQMRALFQSVGMHTVALPDSLRESAN